jgi:hypothetical protein
MGASLTYLDDALCQNLKMRMSVRRFTWLTNGFSKEAEHHAHMVALGSVLICPQQLHA